MSTHGPITETYRAQMKALAETIDEFFNGPRKGNDRKVGFAVLVFEFGDAISKDRINYISNANRKDMITAMKELVARFEGHDHEISTTKQ